MTSKEFSFAKRTTIEAVEAACERPKSSESAKIVYSKEDKQYALEMQLLLPNGVVNSQPLSKQLFESLIKLFKNEGKVQKILGRMD